jgi:YfiH family protein
MFTTRQLRLRGGPGKEPRAWTDMASGVGVPLGRVALVAQVHGRTVRVLARRASMPPDLAEVPEADAIVSDLPGLALAVQVADCVPVLLVDTRTGASGAVHAGWRGTCARIAAAAVEAMVGELGTEPRHLLAAVGPSIGPCCYEVGDDVYAAFSEAGHGAADLTRWFSRASSAAGTRSLRLDVAGANRDQLASAGVPPAAIFACGLCTMTHSTVFDSFRADGALAGRMAAIIATRA